MNIRFLAGKNFDAANNSKAGSALIINKAMVENLNWQNPEQAIGKIIEYFVPETRTFQSANVIGVTDDFHYQSLRHKIEPLVIRLSDPGAINIRDYTATITSLSVKIQGGSVQGTLDRMKAVWKNSNNSYPFEYNFLDDKIKRLYSVDEKLGNIFSLFSLVVLFITAIGLFGISILTIEQRTKEIGIRKVLGATVTNIVSMISKDFLKIVVLAFIISFPLAWWAMNKWLEDFAYRINIEWWVFALAGIIALLIALMTVSFQAIKAAITNPVKNLRTE
jgi:putative ABC transport system permease protein